MKKIFICLLLVLALAGCERDEFSHLTALKVSGPEFKAVVEGFQAESKTLLASDFSSAWTAGDQISIFCGRTTMDKYQLDDASEGMTEGVFKIVESSSEESSDLFTNISLYPSQDGLSCAISQITDGTPGAYRIGGFSFPATQYYVSGSFGEDSYAMAAIADGVDDYTLEFKNLGGALKLQLTGTSAIKKLTLTGNSGEKISGGSYITLYTDGTAPSVAMTYDATKSIVLDCGTGVQLNESVATEFFFSLPPTTFEGGFTIVLESIEGGSGTLSTSAANTVGRSQILSMPVVAAVISEPLDKRSYVDEYGVNRGLGILIDGVVWAPVNCGYRGAVSQDRGYPYGKLYQWGRMYGSGYSLSYDASFASLVAGGSVSVSDGNAESASNVFYTRTDGNNLSNWFSDTEYSSVWNAGTSDAPLKTEYDPCPDGWRMPTAAEMKSLVANKSAWSTVGTQNGYWYSGSTEYSEGVGAVFFPAAGWLHQTGIGQSRGSIGRYWTSTVSDAGTINHLSMNSSSSNVTLNGTVYGCSVRCVADANYFGDTEDGVIEVESITLDATELSLTVGEVSSIKASLLPVEASAEFIEWSSSNPDVVYVDQQGNIYAYAVGEAVVTVTSGEVSATCNVTVSEQPVMLIDYEDEYGVNHGTGVLIDGVVWAPVNCGYLSGSDTDKGYPYGKVYQWGRLDGFGYSSTYDSTVPEVVLGPVEEVEEFDSYYLVAYWWWYRDEGNDYTDYSNTFISASETDSDWFLMPDWDGEEYIERSFFWNWGSSEEPEKSDVDPCPDGWRLPTFAEMELLSKNHSSVSVVDGQKGFWYSGSATYSDGVTAVFLPSAGFLNYQAEPIMRTQVGRYWCSDPSPSGAISALYFTGYDSSVTGETVESSVLGGCSTVNACSVRCVQE